MRPANGVDCQANIPSSLSNVGCIRDVPQLSDIGLWEIASDQASARSLVLWCIIQSESLLSFMELCRLVSFFDTRS